MKDQLKTSERVVRNGEALPEANFLFGGYSWVKKKFQIWSISYRHGDKHFVADPARWLTYSKDRSRIILRKKKNSDGHENFGKIAFAGDQAPLAERLLLEKLNARIASGSAGLKPLDMEPFEVIRDMLRDPNHSETIGGAPQVVKVYQYMRTAPLGVYWPSKADGAVHLLGRACLPYERVDRWVLDPDTLISEVQPPTKGKEQDSSDAVDDA
jgi:hypothetical protein